MSEHEEAHGIPGTDITEGNAPIPLWYKALFVALVIFLIAYFAQYLVGAQPSSAQMK